MSAGPRPLRIYILRMRGFDAERVYAATAGKAKYQVYLRYHDAFGCTFREFLARIECLLHLGKFEGPGHG